MGEDGGATDVSRCSGRDFCLAYYTVCVNALRYLALLGVVQVVVTATLTDNNKVCLTT